MAAATKPRRACVSGTWERRRSCCRGRRWSGSEVDDHRVDVVDRLNRDGVLREVFIWNCAGAALPVVALETQRASGLLGFVRDDVAVDEREVEAAARAAGLKDRAAVRERIA